LASNRALKAACSPMLHFQPLADRWAIYENSEHKPKLLERGPRPLDQTEAHGIAVDLHTETKLKSKRLKNIKRTKT
jgi:hypothetical protein